MGKLSRIQWPQEYSELQRIEELLLCGICYDYMDTSVMTPCSHNYCSLCIRKYLHYKAQCPACFEKTFEKDLHTNRILDELIAYFGQIRTKLVRCVSGARIEADENVENVEDSPRLTPVRPARANQNQRRISSKVEAKRNDALAESEVDKPAPLVTTPEKSFASPSTSEATKIAAIFTPKSKKIATGGPSLPCPVCNVEIPEVNMNRHLDDCLKRQASSQEVARTEQKRKPLPKFVFSLMKDTELRKKIREFGLPTRGDRKTLEARFQRYSTLYNAECDKREPRSVEELLKQCNEEEELEKKMLKISQASDRLKVNRNTKQSIIEEAQKKYLESNKKNYQSLIAAIKERDESKKSSSKSLQNTDDPPSESSDKISSGNRNSCPGEDEEPNRDSFSADDFDADVFDADDFHDSDSDTTCPLQRYTSEDPTSFRSIEMSNSGNSDDSSVIENAANSLGTLSRAKKAPKALSSLARDDKFGDCDEDEGKYSRKMVEGFPRAGNQSNDEDSVPPSPKPASGHSTKRAKLSVRKTTRSGHDDEGTSNHRSEPEGELLALSIARDFTFDTSSDESVGAQAAHEAARVDPPESPQAEARKFEVSEANPPKMNEDVVVRTLRNSNCGPRARTSHSQSLSPGKDFDLVETAPAKSPETEHHKPEASESELPRSEKENCESATSPSSNVVSRPLRKRNSVTRTRTPPSRSKSTRIPIPKHDNDEERAETATEQPGRQPEEAAKRRRRRKLETLAVAKNPPSRPLRKRNSVVKDQNS